jgi:hypothetical protein
MCTSNMADIRRIHEMASRYTDNGFAAEVQPCVRYARPSAFDSVPPWCSASEQRSLAWSACARAAGPDLGTRSHCDADCGGSTAAVSAGLGWTVGLTNTEGCGWNANVWPGVTMPQPPASMFSGCPDCP